MLKTAGGCRQTCGELRKDSPRSPFWARSFLWVDDKRPSSSPSHVDARSVRIDGNHQLDLVIPFLHICLINGNSIDSDCSDFGAVSKRPQRAKQVVGDWYFVVLVDQNRMPFDGRAP